MTITNTAPSAANDTERVEVRPRSFRRGLLHSLLAAACGFVVPYLVISGLLLWEMLTTNMLPFDRDLEWHRLPSKGLAAAITLSWLFALAAFGNSSSRRPIGFVRSLLILASWFLFSVVITAIVVAIFGLDQGRTYTSSGPYAWIGYTFLFVVFFSGVIGLIVWEIQRSEKK